MSAQKAEARLREAEEENEDNRWRLAAAEAEIKDLLSPPMDSWYGFGFLALTAFRQQRVMGEGFAR